MPEQVEQTDTTTAVWGCNATGEVVPIPVLGVTGDFQSGKTLFCLSIAPGNQRTRYYDLELSGTGYKGLGAEHIDVQAEMRKLFGTKEHKPIDLFRWWRDDIMAIEPGRYAVIAVDPIADLESGLTDYVASQYQQFGFGSESKFVSMGGVFWGKVRDYWKALLADIASRCQTFAFTSHLRKVWTNGKPTSKSKPAGKSTLLELASLYLWLERVPDAHGKVPAKPRCKLKLKDRLSYTAFDTETMEPIVKPYLPPAFSDCTPAKIREYIAKPADYQKLKTAERIKEEKLSEADILELETQKYQAQAEAEQLALERMRRRQELQEQMAAAAAKQAKAAPAAPDESGKIKQQAAAASTVDAAEAKEEEPPFDTDQPKQQESQPESEAAVPNKPGYCTTEMASELIGLKQRLGLSLERFQAGIAKHTGGSTNPLDLTLEQAQTIIAKLTEAAEKAGK